MSEAEKLIAAGLALLLGEDHFNNPITRRLREAGDLDENEVLMKPEIDADAGGSGQHETA